MFLKRKYFSGDYASNQISMKRWFNETERGGVIVMRIEDSKFSFNPHVPKTDDFDLLRALISEQAKEFRRSLKKQHQVIIWYVEDHYITRLIGCRPSHENKHLRR